MSKNNDIKYYSYSNIHQGERYFRVKDNNSDVLQIVTKVTEKKGRVYCLGVSYIRYSTFIGSWGWKMKESRWLKEITKNDFNSQLKKMIKMIKWK